MPQHLLRRVTQGVLRAHRPADPRAPRCLAGLLPARHARPAALGGRDFVLPDDIKDIAANVLEHRVMLRPNAELRGLTAMAVLDEVLATESVPMTGRRLA